MASGQKAKARDIIAAVRTLQTIEQENRLATPAEQILLGRFSGFGPIALSIFPDPVTGKYKDAGWQEVGEELQSLLTPSEYESAKRTTFNAFYTSPKVIIGIHEAIARLGVPANATILEPGCGTGNFISRGEPATRFIGIEMDSISGRIAKALHPDQDIRIENFRDTRLPESSIDAVVGNVPFADLKLDYNGLRLALHDYFFAKSVDALKPGGVMALVTSHYTLDKQNAAIREYLAGKADFVGAIRLPSDAFKREGTAVVTDIVFFRKRDRGEPAHHVDPDWLEVAPLAIDGAEVPINRYFINHPEMVLGNWSRKDTLYGGEGYSVTGKGDLLSKLNEAIGRLPRFATGHAAVPSQEEQPPLFQPPPQHRYIAEGSFFVSDNRIIHQVQDGKGVPVVYGGTTLKAEGSLVGKRIAALVGLRDLARRVLQSQNEGWPDSNRSEARAQLAHAHDRFVLAYGPVNRTTISETKDGSMIRRMPNLVKFRDDPDAMLVMSLEHYDETTDKATKAAIMLRDVVGKTPPVTQVKSAEEGLLVSLNQRGTVDLAFIATLYGKPEQQVIAELGDLIFHDPESKTWQTADAYLSGNVREKLATAERAGPAYARNAEALQSVQPEDVLPGDIDANLGAPWIPADDIAAFAADLFHVSPSDVPVAHLKKDAVWSMDSTYAAKVSVGASSEFGTSRSNGTWLIELALNMKTPTIYDTIDHGDREERVVNQEETLAAREKQKLIKERFRTWVFADPDRTERLVREYNDIYNNLRPRLFDGSHLDYPGMNQALTLRPHQNDAVWRGMSSGNTLLAHTVGAGKTFTMAATGMKMKQAGLIKKPMYVVPNHLLEQFSREFMQLYPNAKLLVAAKEDLTRERRKFLTAKIASGEWDGIIVTHSSFERIGMSRDYQEKFLTQQIAEYNELLIEHAGDKGASRNLIKTIEKQKAARAERLENLLANDKKDDGLVFDELGVDHVFIDEAHYFKNLETPTKMDRVAGIQTGGSERAFDVYMKARYLGEQHAGHGVTFATGTPISNTMVEMYTMQRFLDPEGLASRGLEHFDAWAATFGEVVDTMEISPDGGSLRPRSRFARFTNLPELQQMFRAFSDVQTAETLNLPRPHLHGGKPFVVACPMSDDQRLLQEQLVDRYERLRSGGVDPREDNALAITTDGRKLATDARMLSASAPDFPESKVNRLVENVAAIWERTAATRGTQMIFSDMGVNPTAWGYSPYEEIIRKLVAHGIPREQIAAMGDADSDAKKQALFEKVRNGSVRVLLGSTQKMGTGTNVQKRLVALHHLDAPWKPAEVEQRDGRILRQGNENKEVAIYRYVTEGSFDAYMWQALETKARFIGQVITGENAARRAEDIGGQELSYAEVKAIASGNPAVLTLAEADAELQRLALLKKNHLDEQFVARRSVRNLPEVITGQTEYLSKLSADDATAKTHAGDAMTIDGQTYPREDIPAILAGTLDTLPRHVRETTRVPLGRYRGLGFGLVIRPDFPPDVYLEGETTRNIPEARELVSKVFRDGLRSVVWFDCDDADSTLRAFLRLLWPALRAEFCASTYSLQPRARFSTALQLHFAPAAARSRFHRLPKECQIAKGARGDSNEESDLWIRELAGFVSTGRTSPDYRSEVRRYGELLTSDPTSIRSLFMLRDLTSRVGHTPIAAVGILDILESLQPEPDRGVSAKDAALNVAIDEAIQAEPETALHCLYLVEVRLRRPSFTHTSKDCVTRLKEGVSLIVASSPAALFSKCGEESPMSVSPYWDGVLDGLAIVAAEHPKKLLGIVRCPDLALFTIRSRPLIAKSYIRASRLDDSNGISQIVEWIHHVDGNEERSELRRQLIAEAIGDAEIPLLEELLRDLPTDEVFQTLESLSDATQGFSQVSLRKVVAEYVCERFPSETIRWGTETPNWSRAVPDIVSRAFATSSEGVQHILTWNWGSPLRRCEMWSAFVERIASPHLPQWFIRRAADDSSVLEPFVGASPFGPRAVRALETIGAGCDYLPIARSTYAESLLKSLMDLPVRSVYLDKTFSSAIIEYIAGNIEETAVTSLFCLTSASKWCDGVSTDRIHDLLMSFSDGPSWQRAWVTITLLPSSLFKRLEGRLPQIVPALVRSFRAQWSIQAAERWERVLHRARKELAIGVSLKLVLESLSLCLNRPHLPVGAVVSSAFPVVYEAVTTNSTPHVTDELFGYFDWDKAKKLRKDLIEGYTSSNWPPDELALIAARCQILRKVFNRLRRKWNSEGYLTRIIAGLRSRGSEESLAVCRDLTSMMQDPDFFEPWD